MNVKINYMRKDIGARIRELRKRTGLTQEELEEKTGLNYKYIGELERGRVNVSLDSLVKIASAFGIKAGNLFSKEKVPVQKVFVKEKTEKKEIRVSGFSAENIKIIKKAIRILNQVLTIKKR